MIERHPITDRAAWLEWRKQDVTASDVGAICGVSAYKSALRVWSEKAGLIGEDDESNIMRRGRHLEDSVLNYLREEKPEWHICKPNIYLRDTEARIGATPDAVAAVGNDSLIIQCKVVSRPVFEASWSDGAPLSYQLQTLTEAMLWAADTGGLIAALVLDTYTAELRTYPVERHAGAEARIREAVAQFWKDIAAGKTPNADYAKDGTLLREMFKPRSGGEAVDLSSSNRLPELLLEREILKSGIKENEVRCEAIDAEIVEQLRGAEVGLLNGWKISHKTQHRKETVIAAKSFPVLRITRIKEKGSAV